MPIVVGYLRKPTGRLLRALLKHRFPGSPDIGLPEGEDGAPGQGLPGEDEDLTPPWGMEWERPTLPPDFELPTLPPRDEWPPLPPWLQPGVGLPIPPTPQHPMVPVDPEITDPPEIWPPLPSMPELPDMTGKTLLLAAFYVSRHKPLLRWVVVDNEEAKGKVKRALEWLKGRLPAGGIAGRPPQAGNRPPGG